MLNILIENSEYYARFGSQLSVVKVKTCFECLIPCRIIAACFVCLRSVLYRLPKLHEVYKLHLALRIHLSNGIEISCDSSFNDSY